MKVDPIDYALTEILGRLSSHLSSLQDVTKIIRSLFFTQSLLEEFNLNQQKKLLESSFIQPIKRQSILGANVVGVDGGLLQKSLAGLDIIMTRGVATIFYHKKDKVVAKYFPSENPLPELYMNTSLANKEDVEKLATYKRLTNEYEVAIHSLRKYKPDLLLLDGSIAPLESDKPPSITLQKTYHSVILLAQQLYQESKDLQIPIVGVVKDSRSKVFITVLSLFLPVLLRNGYGIELLNTDYRGILRSSTDTLFLNSLLEKNERSAFIRETLDLGLHNSFHVTRDLTYIKPSTFDLPLRLEFLAGEGFEWQKKEQLIGLITSLCGENEDYALPNVLIEADARARLPQTELESLTKELLIRSGLGSTSLKRRSRTPF